MEDILFDLYYKSAHRNEELEQTIEELQGNLKYRRNENIRLEEENKELQRIINDLQSDLVGATNDYKQTVNEVKLLNKQCDKLIAENNELRLRCKMFTKTLLNQLYGVCYADTDSIKGGKRN